MIITRYASPVRSIVSAAAAGRRRVAAAAAAAVEPLEARALLTVTVSGQVYQELNNVSGFQAGDDLALSGWTVLVTDHSDGVPKAVRTDKDGRWQAGIKKFGEIDPVHIDPSVWDNWCGWSAQLVLEDDQTYAYLDPYDGLRSDFTQPATPTTHNDMSVVGYEPVDRDDDPDHCDCDKASDDGGGDDPQDPNPGGEPDADDEGGGEMHAMTTSANPVRYSDGVVVEGATDLSAGGYGMPFAQARSWTNGTGYARDNTNGNGWVSDSLWRLTEGDAGSIAVVLNGHQAQWFDLSGGAYHARHDARDTLTYGAADDGSGTNEFVLTLTDGTQARFYDLYSSTLSFPQAGGFKSLQSPGASRLAAFAHDTTGNVTDLRRSVTVGATTTTESWKYDYLTTGANTGKLSRVTLRRSTDGGSTWSTVRQVAYDYYDDYATTAAAADQYGNLGDLRTAQVQDAAGTALDTWYYRYFRSGDADIADGYVGGLKYVVAPQGYARLAAALTSGTTPLTAADATLAPYADKYYKYDGSGRVKAETVAAAGTNQGSGDGRGLITYSYTTSGNADGYNSWKTKTVETDPDGGTITVYTNYVGQVMLRAAEDHSTGQTFSGKKVAAFNHYDAHGRVDLRAKPSAFDPHGGTALWDDAYADLLHDTGSGNYYYLGDAFGEVDTFAYATSTSGTISGTVAGDVAGLVKATYAKLGDTGTPVQQSATTYYQPSYTPSGTGGVLMTANPVAAVSLYPDAVAGTPGTALTTNYTYTYLANSVHVASVKAERPVVGTGHNGPGGSGRDTDWAVFDAYGEPVWTKDAAGFLTYMSWDAVTAAPLTAIEDVDTSQTGTFANLPALPSSPWATPSGGGLHLTTTFGHDALGRVTKAHDANGHDTYTVYDDPNHATLTFRGWDATAHTTTGPVEIAREYRPAANATSGQQTLYDEALTTSATPTYNGSNEPTGVGSLSNANVLSLSRALTNNAGQVTAVDGYFSLSSLTYAQGPAVLASAAASNDSASGNYHETAYGYDAAGRRSVVKSQTGTIARTVFDNRGNVAAVWVGTNDAAATDLNPAGSGGTNNMVDVEDVEYDQSCGCPHSSGDGRPTKITYHPGGSEPDRVTQNYYDWRGRLVATKDGVQGSETTADNYHPIAYYDLNNLGQVTAASAYDGDTNTAPATRTNGVPDKPSSSLLRAKTAYAYDEQDRPYAAQTYSVDPATGTVSSAALTTNTYYGPRGEVAATSNPGGPWTKQVYDGAGRLSKSYATDGAGGTAYACATSAAADHVLEQAEYAYDGVGNVTLTTARQRFHDATDVGALGTPSSGSGTAKARVSYVADYYDAADRPTDWVDFGTNAAVALTGRPGVAAGRTGASGTADSGSTTTLVDAPLSGTSDSYVGYTLTITAGTNAGKSATVTAYNGSTHTLTFSPALPAAVDATSVYALAATPLVTSYAYDDANRVVTTTDPRGTAAKTYYDLLGRTTKAVAAYVDGTPSAADDQTTLYTYDGAGHVLTMKADVPGTDEVTQYVYGVTTAGGSGVNSNDLLLETRYPNKSTGAAGTTSADKEQYTYNAVGQVRTFTDKAASVHAYAYDVLGRQTTDAVTTLGSGVDGTVRRLETAYNTQGLADTFTSLGQDKTASTITHSGTTATATLSGHGLAVGDTVVVLGASDAAYNGTFTVTAVTSTTFQYTTATTPGANVTNVTFRKLVNQVKNAFNGLGQLTAEYQSHNGAVNTSTTPKVQYAYTQMAGGANHSRLTKVTYPTGRVVRYEYGTTGTLDDKVSRVTYLADDASGTVGTHLVDYSYLGLSTIVDKNHPENGVDTTSIAQGVETPTDAGDKYTGLDRFGRVIDQRSIKSGTAIDRFQYGYDADSNVLYKNNLVSSTHSELYHANGATAGYDKLDRLTDFRRGTLSDANADGTPDTVTTAGTTNSWTLDALGNWTSGGGDTSRTHDARNELTGSNASGCTTSFAYDANGSLTQANDTTAGTVAKQRYAYDAWNRQATACTYSTAASTYSPTATYSYDALGRRVKQTLVKDTGVPSGTGTRVVATSAEDRYYSAAWQVLDDQCSTTCVTTCYVSGASCGSSTSTTGVDDQYVWGLGYVDDLVLRDRSATGVSALDPSFNSTGRATADFASGTDVAHAVAVQDDGKVVVAGTTTSGSNSDLAIVRYKADGTPDTTFGAAGTGKVTASRSTAEGWGAIDLEASGNILVAGYETNGSGNKDFLLARYLPNGTLDTTFGTGGFVQTDVSSGGDDLARAVLEQPDGSIVLAGDAVVGGVRKLAVVRYTSTGTLDSTFGTGGKVTLATGTGAAFGYGLVLQPDGKLVVAGYASTSGKGTDMVAARFNSNGSLDDGGGSDSTGGDSFGTSGVATVDFASADDHAYAVALAPDGSVYLAGDATTGGSAFSAVAKLTPAGVLDTTFNAAGTVPGTLTRLTAGSVANAVAVDGLGRAVVAGSVVRSGGTDHDLATYRLNPDGAADTTFGASGTVQTNFPTNKDDAAYAVAVTATAVVVAGGSGGDFAVARYVPGGSAVQRVYALQDANYDVTALVDTSGSVVERFDYDPYGRSSVLTSGWGSTTDTYDWSVRFQGGKQEAATGAYGFRHRDYDPTLGRWLEEDVAGYVDGANRYQVVVSNPTNFVDPNGLCKLPVLKSWTIKAVRVTVYTATGKFEVEGNKKDPRANSLKSPVDPQGLMKAPKKVIDYLIDAAKDYLGTAYFTAITKALSTGHLFVTGVTVTLILDGVVVCDGKEQHVTAEWESGMHSFESGNSPQGLVMPDDLAKLGSGVADIYKMLLSMDKSTLKGYLDNAVIQKATD